jgi:hypothetical protein
MQVPPIDDEVEGEILGKFNFSDVSDTVTTAEDD